MAIIKEYFHTRELCCQCGCGKMPDIRSIEMLYALMIIYDKPIKVLSGARCEAHNKAVGGSENSAHLMGAFDIWVPPADEWRVIQIAQAVGFNGIGFKDNRFLHLDWFHAAAGQVWGY